MQKIRDLWLAQTAEREYHHVQLRPLDLFPLHALAYSKRDDWLCQSQSRHPSRCFLPVPTAHAGGLASVDLWWNKTSMVIHHAAQLLQFRHHLRGGSQRRIV